MIAASYLYALAGGNKGHRQPDGKMVQTGYGFKSGGSGGLSRIRVMVTRRLAESEGSSGNSGWVSAFPTTLKICELGSPWRSRMRRTTLARSADSSNAP